MGLDINRIKQFNNRVTESKQKVAQDRAEIEVSRREIARLCKELSTELGVEVTEQNVEQIYNEHVKKVMEQLENGEAILNRIDAGEVAQTSIAQSAGNIGNIGHSSYGQNVAQQMNAGQMFNGQGVVNQQTPLTNGQQFSSVPNYMNQPVQQAPVQQAPVQPVQQAPVQQAPVQQQPQGLFAGMPSQFGFPPQFQVGNNDNNSNNGGNTFSI